MIHAWLYEVVTPKLASELSLVLAGFLPADPSVKEAWFMSTDAADRLEQQVRCSGSTCHQAAVPAWVISITCVLHRRDS